MFITRISKKEKVSFILLAIMIVTWMSPVTGFAELQDVVDSRDEKEMILYEGDLVTLKVYSLTRIAVQNPNIVDIANADVDEIIFIGKATGKTQIFIWDEYGKRSIMARVYEEDLDMAKERIESYIEASGVQGITVTKDKFERKVILEGKIPQTQIKFFRAMLKSMEGIRVVYMLRESKTMISIDAQVSELNTTLQKALGFDWTTSGNSLILNYEEQIQEFDGSVRDLFKIGKFSRTSFITAVVDAYINEGKGRVLSKPSVVVSDGESASFLVGGEIPVRTVTATNGGTATTESINFKAYGIELKVTPVVEHDDKILLDVSLSVRDVDAANAVGENVAFTTRSTATNVLVDDGQTVVIAGLIRQNENEVIKRVPFLGDVPILGALFRTRSNPAANQEQEVVITMTPRLIKSIKRNVEEKEMDLDEYLELSDLEENRNSLESEETLADSEDEYSEDFYMDDLEEEMVADIEEEMVPVEEEEFEVVEEVVSQEMVETNGNISAVIQQYVKSIQKRISQSISFPYEAKEKGWEGTTTLTLVIHSDGSLDDVSVKETSGHDIFDNDAINTTRILAPFEPFPTDLELEELEVTIPINYSSEIIFNEV